MTWGIYLSAFPGNKGRTDARRVRRVTAPSWPQPRRLGGVSAGFVFRLSTELWQSVLGLGPEVCMRMFFAGLTLLLAVAACQRRNAATPGGDVETGAKASMDTAAQPQMNPPAPTDTTTKPDTTKKP